MDISRRDSRFPSLDAPGRAPARRPGSAAIAGHSGSATRRVVWSLLLLALGGCATGTRTLEPAALIPVRHPYMEQSAGWATSEGGIINKVSESRQIPATESLALVRGWQAQDFESTCVVEFDRTAVAGVVFNAVQKDSMVVAMRALTLGTGGIDLWRLDGPSWVLLERHKRPFAADEPHVLRIRARGDKIAVGLDGEALFENRDTFLRERGGVGVYAREGRCRFHSVTFKNLDPKGTEKRE